MIKKLIPIILLATTLTSQAQTFNKAKMDSVLDVLAANHKTMGSMALSQNGKIIYQKTVGYAAATAPLIPSNDKTKYRIGSISKMFTGVMIFQLIDEGKLTVATTLDKFFPQFPNAAKISIGNMLNHHSGLHNFTVDRAYAGYMATPQTQEQMVAHAAALPSDFEPGTKAEYSNTNFLLLGYIVEKLTSQTYAEAVKKRIVNKAGLKDTYFGGKIEPANNEARSYYYTSTWNAMPETDISVPAGAGGMVSTAADLNKFIEALFNGKLVSTASLEKMKSQQDKMGMAMFVVPFDTKKGYGHGGIIDGFQSTLSYYPEDKLAVTYIRNGGSYSPDKVAIAALSIYYNKPYKVPSFAEPKGGIDAYLGIYASPSLPIKITISKDGTSLMAQATGQSAFPLDGTSTADKYVFEQAGIVMLFDPANNKFTLQQGGAEYVFTKE